MNWFVSNWLQLVHVTYGWWWQWCWCDYDDGADDDDDDPEYMKDMRKSSQLGFGVYSWLQLVDLVSRHDTSEVYETWFFK